MTPITRKHWIPAAGLFMLAALFTSMPSTARAAEIRGIMDKCLEANRRANGADGTPVVLNFCDGDASQSWTFSNGLILSSNGKCLDAYGGDQAGQGSQIFIYPCHGRANQQWAPVSGTIRGKSGMCLDVKGGFSSDGSPTLLWPCHGGSNQGWTVNASGYSPQTALPGLRLCNTTNLTVSAAVGRYLPIQQQPGMAIDGVPETTVQGWWNIGAGQCVQVYNTALPAGAQYYVYGTAGSHRFSGDTQLCTQHQAFSVSDRQGESCNGERKNFARIAGGPSVTFEFRPSMDW